MEAKKRQRRNVGREQHPVHDVKLRQSPFLKAFLKTDRVWDDAAKTEWADDVERRLCGVRSQIDPGPLVLGYAIERSGNSVVIYTVVSGNELSNREIAALFRGEWPCWDEIVKVVPEFIHSKTEFDACMNFEWWRKWDVEDEMSRIRLDDGICEQAVMSKNEMKVRLGHPVVIFIHSLALLLIGVAIGMHWQQSHPTAIWIALCGALLTVINEMISGFFWLSIASFWIRKNKRAGVANGNV